MGAMPALERLAKWRVHLAGWQLGTRSAQDPESQAVRDHREATLLLRVEVTALLGLLIDKGVLTLDEVEARAEREADLLSMALEARWPGATATDLGMTYDMSRAMEWLKGWRP